MRNKARHETLENLLQLSNKSKEIEQRIPLLSFKATDDISQIKHFI